MPSAFAAWSNDASLVVKTLTSPKVSRDIFVVTKRGRSLSPACDGFLDVMRAEFDRKPA
ncbi:MAG: hypothetical protein R3E92_02180 [Burkholderiaceae bacterium]